MPTLDLAGVIDIYQTLDAIKHALPNHFHRYRAAAMRRRLADVCEPMLEMQKEQAKIIPYEFVEKRLSLLQQYARKGPDGKPVVANENYVIDVENRPAFDDANKKLRAEYKEQLDRSQEEADKINAALRESVEYPDLPNKFKLSWFSPHVDQGWLETLMDYIEDDSAEVEAAKAEAAKDEKASKK